MAERPILFSGPMARAILDGRKTQTRRAIKGIYFVGGKGEENDPSSWGFEDRCGEYHVLDNDGGRLAQHQIRCPYGQPGDLLYVREAFALSQYDPDSAEPDTLNPDDWDPPVYRVADRRGEWTDADGNKIDPPWRPSIHMPKWAARIWLRVKDVRVERLQEISEDDCWAEGLVRVDKPLPRLARTAPTRGEPQLTTPKQAFAALWDTINKKRGFSWESNPWVWVVGFERVEREEG